MPYVPKKPSVTGGHTAHHDWMHKRLTGASDNRLIVAGPGIVLGVNEHGQYMLEATARRGASGSVRLLLCDSVTGESAYYLVAAELDPDQTPSA